MNLSVCVRQCMVLLMCVNGGGKCKGNLIVLWVELCTFVTNMAKNDIIINIQIKNKMKKISSLLILVMLTIGMGLTSCDEQLDNAVDPGVMPAVEEEVKLLGAALEKGATVTINYTAGGTSYIATFQKGDGDAYTLISNYKKPSTTRAMTRSVLSIVSEGDGASLGDKMQLKLVGDNLLFSVMTFLDSPLFEALINVVSGEVTVHNTNAFGFDSTIGGFSVNDEPQNIKVPEMQSVKVLTDKELSFAVKYIDGESWADVTKRNDEWIEITTTTEGYVSVIFSNKLIIETLKGETEGTKTLEELEALYNTYFSGSFYLYVKENSNLNSRARTRAVAYIYTPIKSTDPVDVDKTYILGPAVPHALTSAVVGEIVGDDGKAYASDKYKLSAIGVKAVAMVAYKSETVGSSLAIALEDVSENKLSWNNSGTNNNSKTAAQWCSEWNTSNSITGGNWQLPSKDQWNNMIQGLGGASSLQTKLGLQDNYWSSIEHESNTNDAYRYNFGNNGWYQGNKNDLCNVRACLAF